MTLEGPEPDYFAIGASVAIVVLFVTSILMLAYCICCRKYG